MYTVYRYTPDSMFCQEILNILIITPHKVIGSKI